jgi:hypothetical protein
MKKSGWSRAIGPVLAAALAGPLPAGATQYHFRPQQATALYTDTANWQDRRYPGLQVGNADSVFFEPASFDSAIINQSVQVAGYWQVAAGVHMRIAPGCVLTSYANLVGPAAARFTSAAGSSLLVEGGLSINGNQMNWQGQMLIKGTMGGDPELNWPPGIFQQLYMKDLQVWGRVSGIATHLSADTLRVYAGATLRLQGGYEFNGSACMATVAVNHGTIEATDETQFSFDSLENHSLLAVSYLGGRLYNYGTVQVQGKALINAYAAQLSSVVNKGVIDIGGEWPAPVVLANVDNDSTMRLYGLVSLQGGHNKKSLSIQSTDSSSVINGSWTNTGGIGILGSVQIASPSFANAGWLHAMPAMMNHSPAYGTLLISGVLQNTGSMRVWYTLTVSGSLLNSGLLEQRTE